MLHRFRSVLIQHPEVARQAQTYPVAIEPASDLPKNFDGRDIWGTYLIAPSPSAIRSASWAVVAKNVLNDRFCLQSGGQLLTNFDEFEIISCIASPPHTLEKGDTPYERSTQGYSIFDAWEYLYQYGVCQQHCFPLKEIDRRNLARPDKINEYVDKIRTYGVNCSVIEDPGRTRCLTEQDGKPIARRAFLCDAIYRVGRGKTWEETVQRIKQDIVRYGPVAAGMVVYENFAEGLENQKKWRGYTPYEKTEGKVLGTHYVSIVGFEGDHWICRNTWGADWGLLGYFKIKMGLCQLEDNVSACMPYLYQRRANGEDNRPGEMDNGKKVNLYDISAINPFLAQSRSVLHIDFATFYSEETVRQIASGRLSGDMTPLILYPKYLPDMRHFWVKDILNYSYPTISGQKSDELVTKWWIGRILRIVAMIIVCWIGYR